MVSSKNIPEESKHKKTRALTYQQLITTYNIDSKGVLLSKETNEPLPKEDKELEVLSDALLQYLQKHYLISQLKMKEVWIPENSDNQCNIFLSDDFYTNNTAVVVLIQGSGFVRAGQWSCGLCLNIGVEHGSMMSYLTRAKESGYAYIILNPNYNENVETLIPIQGHEDATKHVSYVWDVFINKLNVRNLFVVAHSFGGHCICKLMSQSNVGSLNKISSVALLESVHGYGRKFDFNSEVQDTIQNHSASWKASDMPLDTYLGIDNSGIKVLSGGSRGHSEVALDAVDSVFNLFKNALK
ncbi:cotranscriptional regulator FAM172 [Acrasis kona]|uniref:Cotranscriptional regulator FAM172 n=1 Tax=Acrasis kona TaxID=1008807 RepID=A0AAW2Z963_9EUKA